MLLGDTYSIKKYHGFCLFVWIIVNYYCLIANQVNGSPQNKKKIKIIEKTYLFTQNHNEQNSNVYD